MNHITEALTWTFIQLCDIHNREEPYMDTREAQITTTRLSDARTLLLKQGWEPSISDEMLMASIGINH